MAGPTRNRPFEDSSKRSLDRTARPRNYQLARLILKSDAGAPTLQADEGVFCWAIPDDKLYINTDGLTSWLLIASSGGVAGYTTIQEEGSGLTQRAVMNFIGAMVTAADNGGSGRSDITVVHGDRSGDGGTEHGMAQLSGAISDGQHGARGSGLHSDSHAQAHHAAHEPAGGDAMAADAAAGTASLRSLGTTSVKACAGNDSRLSDARAPTAHKSSHLTGGSDVLALVQDIEFVIDGGGVTITTGMKGMLEIDFPCTINQVTLLGDVASGSIVVAIWKCTYAQFDITTHPVTGDNICASAKPTITTAAKSQDATLTGWTKTVAAGDILAFNVDSVSTFNRVSVVLKVTRT